MLLETPPSAGEFFILRNAQTGEPVGRIGASRAWTRGEVGYVGFFELDLALPDRFEAGRLLLEASASYLKRLGCQRMIGPVELSTWFNYRFRVGHTLGRIFSWEPSNPPEYPECFSSFGFEPLEFYHSQGYSALDGGESLPHAEALKVAFEKVTQAGFRFRAFDMQRLIEHEIPILHRLSHECFRDAFLYEPIPLRAFTEIYAAALARFDASPSRFILAPSGEEMGFVFAFIDGDHLIVKTMAVVDSFRNQGLSTAVLYPLLEFARARNIQHAVSALVKTGALSEHHERRHAQPGFWRHDYVLFSKGVS